MNIYDEIKSLIRQGYNNKQIQDKLMVTYAQINYQRKKIQREVWADQREKKIPLKYIKKIKKKY